MRIDADGNEKAFETCREAAEDCINGLPCNIYRAIRDGVTAYGYRWRWAEE